MRFLARPRAHGRLRHLRDGHPVPAMHIHHQPHRRLDRLAEMFDGSADLAETAEVLPLAGRPEPARVPNIGKRDLPVTDIGARPVPEVDFIVRRRVRTFQAGGKHREPPINALGAPPTVRMHPGAAPNLRTAAGGGDQIGAPQSLDQLDDLGLGAQEKVFSTRTGRPKTSAKSRVKPASAWGWVVRVARDPITWPTGGRFRLTTPFS